jgi:hypothetical protein
MHRELLITTDTKEDGASGRITRLRLALRRRC